VHSLLDNPAQFPVNRRLYRLSHHPCHPKLPL
jgi:hypothetical protein